MTPEAKIVRSIQQHIKTAPNSFVVKIHAGIEQGKHTLDLLGSYRGVPFCIEVKTPSGTTSPMQSALVKRFRQGGYVSGVVSSVREFQSLFDD